MQFAQKHLNNYSNNATWFEQQKDKQDEIRNSTTL